MDVSAFYPFAGSQASLGHPVQQLCFPRVGFLAECRTESLISGLGLEGKVAPLKCGKRQVGQLQVLRQVSAL